MKRICEQNEIKIFLIIIIIVFNVWLHWVFVAAHGLSLIAASRHFSSLWRAGFCTWGLPLLRSTGSRHSGFSSCGVQASICGLQVLEHGLSSCAQAEWFHRGKWLFYRDINHKKGSNTEFADGLVVRIQCFHCCAWILSWSGIEFPGFYPGNWDPSISAVRPKNEKEPNRNSFAQDYSEWNATKWKMLQRALKGCCWMIRCQDSWPLEGTNSIWGQRRGWIAQSFCVIKFY